MVSSKARPIYDSAAFKIPFIYTLRELYRYRYLIGHLVSRDLKVRYKRSLLGFAWVMLNPLLLMGSLAFAFSSLFSGQHIEIYVLSGILLWNTFAQGTTAAMSSMHANSGTLRRVYVPASVFVFSAVGSALINLLFSLVPFTILAMLFGILPTWRWLYLIIPIFQLILLCMGIGLIVSSLAVFFVDTIEIYAALLQVYFFLTPVMYPLTILPVTALQFQKFNPMFYILTNFRQVILEQRFPALRLTLGATFFALLILLIGWIIFSKVKDRFAYRL